LFISPLLVKKLGIHQYGVWVLLISSMEYLRLLDFGLRSAVINRVARQQTLQNWQGVNQTLSTGILYFSVMSAVCCAAAFVARHAFLDFLKIEPALRPDAVRLLLIIAASIAARLVFSPLTAALEAFQRFDLINRAYLGNLTVRAAGSLALLFAGYGLVPLGWLVLAVAIGEDIWNILSLRRIFPQLRLSALFVRRDAFREMVNFGKHTSLMAIANMVEWQSPTTLLGVTRGPTEVGFFALPWRLLMYTTEALSKLGQVTTSMAAEYDATADAHSVRNMVIATNRMCLALFMPLAIFLFVFATPLMTVWVSAEVGRHSGPILPILVVPFLLAIAAQYNSGSVLIGQARHRLLAWSIVAEAAMVVAGILLVAPTAGALGVAWVVSAGLMTVRGGFLAFEMCRVNGFSMREYLGAIYGPPLLAAIPAVTAAIVMRALVLPGRNWFELIGAGAVIATVYFASAFATVLDADTRRRIFDRLAPRRAAQRTVNTVRTGR
jgi:O-antigen/teichoic acid export membrane protein